MADGKETLIALQIAQDPITQFETKFNELENGFKACLAKQTVPVEAAVVTATSAALAAAIGAFVGTLTKDAALAPPPGAGSLNPQAMASLYIFLLKLINLIFKALAGGPMIQARTFAVLAGIKAGISCVMKRLRGKEDVQSSMVAAFGSAAMLPLVCGTEGPNHAARMVIAGLLFALLQGGLFKFGEKFSQPPAEDVYYTKTRSMLTNLDLQNYEFQERLVNRYHFAFADGQCA